MLLCWSFSQGFILIQPHINSEADSVSAGITQVSDANQLIELNSLLGEE